VVLRPAASAHPLVALLLVALPRLALRAAMALRPLAGLLLVALLLVVLLLLARQVAMALLLLAELLRLVRQVATALQALLLRAHPELLPASVPLQAASPRVRRVATGLRQAACLAWVHPAVTQRR